MGLLTGKKALILGVANDMSIAWGIAKALKAEGASVALSYLNENLLKRVEPLANEVGADFIFEMDVTIDEHYPKLKKTVDEKWGKFDILIHSLAFADKTDLKGRFVETSRDGFKMACDISAFSLIGLCNSLRENLNDDASVIAMTYHGSTKVLKGYNVMGVAKAALEASTRYLADDLGPQNIRVNCISAGPIRTLAASGVPGLKDFLKVIEEKAPLRKNVTQDDVGGTAVYLASRLSHGVTGQVLYVDSGINIMAQ
ncbi:MAG: enoyl-ACP reductase [Bacteriovoracaceae bacterium]|nr:enoyl-ACP reductase [Bacteriovoracaceae bacterium]